MDENGECVICTCTAGSVVVGGTWFNEKLISNYTWEHDSRDARSMTDHVILV